MTDEQKMLEIDEDRLDEECKEQVNMVARNRKNQTKARTELDTMKAKYKIVYSKALIQVRKRPGRYDLDDNPPVDLIKAAVELVPDVQKAAEAVRDAEEILRVFRDQGSVLYDRKKTLENLCQLASMDWHSTPNTEKGERFKRMQESRKQDTRHGIKRERG